MIAKSNFKLLPISYIIMISIALCSLNFDYKENDLNSKRDYVPDEVTAIKIAEAIWMPIYGSSIYQKRPFIAILNKRTNIWTVTGTILEGKGGVPYIEIQKSDCKIIKVYHDK